MEALLTRNEVVETIVQGLMSHESKLSYSSLSAFKDSPKSFIDYKLGKKEQTEAMVYGSMVHCLVLDPDDFNNRYLALNDDDICIEIGGAKPRSTNKYKEWYAKATDLKGDRIIIDPAQYKHAKAVSENVRHNRASRKVMNMCPQHELAVDWEYKNFLFHGFIDGFGDAVFDLKTCADAEQNKFHRDIVNMGYYLQAAMYLYGKGAMRDYYIIAVDKMGGVSVHLLEDRLIEHGMKEYEMLLGKFNECILSDAWDQSYDFWAERWDGIFTAEKPGYLY